MQDVLKDEISRGTFMKALGTPSASGVEVKSTLM